MFNLVVTGSKDAWSEKWVSFPIDRFLEITKQHVKVQFSDLTEGQIAALMAMPAVFIFEGSDETEGRIGRITRIRRRYTEVGFTYEFLDDIPPVSWGTLKKLSWHLDIVAGEHSRTHWAVKEADLFAVLQLEDGVPAELQAAAGRQRSGARPSRGELLDAAKDLEQLGHSDFDRMLLEFGVPSLVADRGVGGLKDRANALAKFAIDHPDARTASNADLWAEIAARATRLREERPASFSAEAPSEPKFSWKRSAKAPIEAELAAPAPQQGVEALSDRIKTPAASNKVFLVHGRDGGTKHEVARFLERIGLEVTILHEQPSRGRTLISKFQEESVGISYAVVLMTPDDEGGLAGGEKNARARQNVVFELGFFIGRLGADRVCALVKDAVEKPSDFEAVVYVPLDAGGAWKTELARELKAADLKFDPAKVFS